MGEYELAAGGGRRRSFTRMRQIGVAVVVVVGAGGLVGMPDAHAAPAATFTVNTVDDVDDGTCDGTHCSLREAINAANATVAEDAVHFDLSGPAPHVIQPTSGVFAYRPVTIDGTTQPGHAGTPVVQLDGSLVTSGDGVQFQGSGSTVRGLSITGFPSAGVWLRGDNHVIESSWIGVAIDGSADGGFQGVTVSGSGNRVGGVGDLGNVIADSFGTGIGVGGSNNRIEGNTVGLAPDGSAPASPNPF
ncbi:MAG: CSLREA domain-containing protein [Microthrixaceae bacterium]